MPRSALSIRYAEEMKLLLALLGIVLSAQTARAKDAPEVTAAHQLLDAQIAAINAHDPKAFAAAFDARGYLIFPIAAEARSSAKIETVAKPWLVGLGKTTAKADHVRIGKMADTHCAWISAEIVATGDTALRWRVTELVAPLQSLVEKPTAADYRVLAAEISEPIDDKASLTAKLPALPTIEDGQQPMGGEAVSPGGLASLALDGDPAVTFIGSAPKELVTGKAGVAAMAKSFKSLDLKELSSLGLGDANSMAAAGADVWHVQVTYKVGKQPVVIPYRVLLIYYGPAPGQHRAYTLCVAHFSVAQR
jgi:hypothetical protein